MICNQYLWYGLHKVLKWDYQPCKCLVDFVLLVGIAIKSQKLDFVFPINEKLLCDLLCVSNLIGIHLIHECA